MLNGSDISMCLETQINPPPPHLLCSCMVLLGGGQFCAVTAVLKPCMLLHLCNVWRVPHRAHQCKTENSGLESAETWHMPRTSPIQSWISFMWPHVTGRLFRPWLTYHGVPVFYSRFSIFAKHVCCGQPMWAAGSSSRAATPASCSTQAAV